VALAEIRQKEGSPSPMVASAIQSSLGSGGNSAPYQSAATEQLGSEGCEHLWKVTDVPGVSQHWGRRGQCRAPALQGRYVGATNRRGRLDLRVY
jgi:hypothetical protein